LQQCAERGVFTPQRRQHQQLIETIDDGIPIEWRDELGRELRRGYSAAMPGV